VIRSRVLVLCTPKSARSQLAEGLAAFRRVRDQIAGRLRGWLAGRAEAAA
jgi:hypothetical protein